MSVQSTSKWARSARFGVAAVFAVVAVASVSVGQAQAGSMNYTLTDGNSVTKFSVDSPDGQFSWKVENPNGNFVETLNRQWFWFRLDGDAAETSLDQLDPTPDVTVSDRGGEPDAGKEVLEVVYTGSELLTKVTYTLFGGGPGSNTAQLRELIEVTNTSESNLTVDFFQLVDFDLPLQVTPDHVKIRNGAIAEQYSSAMEITETVLSEAPETAAGAGTAPLPSRYDVGDGGDGPGSLYDQLQDASLTDLIYGYGDGDTPTYGGSDNPDVAWAFQWTQQIAPGESFAISKVKGFTQNPTNVPEPATAMLMVALGAFCMTRGRSRRAA